MSGDAIPTELRDAIKFTEGVLFLDKAHRIVEWNPKKFRFVCVRCGICCTNEWIGKTDPLLDGCSCRFLKNKRCANYNQRPLYCRNFPFIVTNNGKRGIWLDCPGLTVRKN
jgi:Fe-S-cluster containining protein